MIERRETRSRRTGRRAAVGVDDEPRPTVRTAWARTPAARGLRELVQVAGLRPLTHAQVRLDVHGLEELRDFTRPALIVANHSSHLDTAVLLSTLPGARRRRTAVAAAADYFFDTWWRAGGSAIAFNTFPIARGGTSRLATPGELLGSGWSVLVYPEGTRSPDGFPGRFKLGAAWLAVQHQVPVIPVGLRGTYAAMPRGSRLPVRGRPRVSVRYGAPILPRPGSSVRELAPEISAAVAALVAEDATSWWAVQRGIGGPPDEPPPGSWRRPWQQSEPPTEGGLARRPSIWRG